MRVVSLLPSATEALFALGLGDDVVAVTHECDFPPEAASRPIVTRSILDLAGESSASIDEQVAAAAMRGQPLYEVDTAAIRALQPDLVVAQDVCRVCAVTAAQVGEAVKEAFPQGTKGVPEAEVARAVFLRLRSGGKARK